MQSGIHGAATLGKMQMSCCISLLISMIMVAPGFYWSGKHNSTKTSASSEMNIFRTRHLNMARRA